MTAWEIVILISVTTILGLLSNIVASWIEPSLNKQKVATIIVFVAFLIISGVIYHKTNSYTSSNSLKTPKVDSNSKKVIDRDTAKASQNKLFEEVASDSITSQKQHANDIKPFLTDTLFVVDQNGNRYSTFKFESLTWLSRNLTTDIGGSYIYDNNSQNLLYSGRLYTWRAAFEACTLLGNGWRLPTRNEFINLVKYKNGGYYIYQSGGTIPGMGGGGYINYGNPQKGFLNITGDSSIQFNLIFGGYGKKVWYRSMQFSDLYKSANFWAFSDNDKIHSYFVFDSDAQFIEVKYESNIPIIASCRCVKDSKKD